MLTLALTLILERVFAEALWALLIKASVTSVSGDTLPVFVVDSVAKVVPVLRLRRVPWGRPEADREAPVLLLAVIGLKDEVLLTSSRGRQGEGEGGH